MKKDIILVNAERGVYQITTTDERWYMVPSIDEETRLPFYKFIPSVTWITGYVPKGIEFYKWLAGKGWDKTEAIKAEAGEKGSKIHKCCEMLLAGETVSMETKIANGDGIEKELTPEEYGAVISFKTWYDKMKPKTLLGEINLISEQFNFAGTVDYVARIKGQLYIVDFKSSQYVWPSMKAQISAYKYALIEMINKGIITNITLEEAATVKLAILQLGYKKNKSGYKFTEFEDKFDALFLPAQQFWAEENLGKQPKQYELPVSIKLNININNNVSQQTDQGPCKADLGGVPGDEELQCTPSDDGVQEVLFHAGDDPREEITGSNEILQPGRHNKVEEKVQQQNSRSRKLSRGTVLSDRSIGVEKEKTESI